MVLVKLLEHHSYEPGSVQRAIKREETPTSLSTIETEMNIHIPSDLLPSVLSQTLAILFLVGFFIHCCGLGHL